MKNFKKVLKNSHEMTNEELQKRLKKLPGDYKIRIDVDDAYTSYIRSIHIDQYSKKQGRNEITIKV